MVTPYNEAVAKAAPSDTDSRSPVEQLGEALEHAVKENPTSEDCFLSLRQLGRDAVHPFPNSFLRHQAAGQGTIELSSSHGWLAAFPKRVFLDTVWCDCDE